MYLIVTVKFMCDIDGCTSIISKNFSVDDIQDLKYFDREMKKELEKENWGCYKNMIVCNWHTYLDA